MQSMFMGTKAIPSWRQTGRGHLHQGECLLIFSEQLRAAPNRPEQFQTRPSVYGATVFFLSSAHIQDLSGLNCFTAVGSRVLDPATSQGIVFNVDLLMANHN